MDECANIFAWCRVMHKCPTQGIYISISAQQSQDRVHYQSWPAQLLQVRDCIRKPIGSEFLKITFSLIREYIQLCKLHREGSDMRGDISDNYDGLTKECPTTRACPQWASNVILICTNASILMRCNLNKCQLIEWPESDLRLLVIKHVWLVSQKVWENLFCSEHPILDLTHLCCYNDHAFPMKAFCLFGAVVVQLLRHIQQVVS